ncbi:phosphotransferase [Candidatus Amarobacter glycogenicus]|uniref:phosphotransferase family protein n=1 Tax=Candidatus Amarobacter glycogenicus TaxID=3140699 RepID=UPI003134C597|nr:phosphotransferase [Dehalococcoidia bacterium]
MASREYSKRLGALSDRQLQAALDRFGLGRLNSAEPLTNGLFGQNLMLETSSGAYVFRGAPHWDLDGKDDWQFQKERWFSRTVHESPGGPSVPWPYLLDESRDLFGWGFAIQPRLPGEVLALSNPRPYSAPELAEQSRQLGTALAQLHTLTLPEAGRHNPRTDAIEPFATPYVEYVSATLEDLLTRSLAASNATTEADVAWARSVLERARPALELPFRPTAVHLDFGFHNVLFEQRDGHWRLTGVIDWMTAEAGHPECDLSRPLATDRQSRIGAREAFLGAYEAVHPRTSGFEERFRAFMLWERLLIWQYWQAQPQNDFGGIGMREWIEPFVEMLR